MKFVLLLTLISIGGVNNSRIQTLTTAEFDDKAACESARGQIVRFHDSISTQKEQTVLAVCYPKSSQK